MTDAEKQDLINRLGPLAVPFGRRKGEQNTTLLDGECDDFSDQTEDKSTNGEIGFEEFHLLQEESQDPWNLNEGKKFLWLIDLADNDLRLRLIPELTPNDNRAKGIVCHTNISKCEEALQGGECWWYPEKETLFINNKSGRYGAQFKIQWNAVLEYFRKIGYAKLIDIRDYTNTIYSLK